MIEVISVRFRNGSKNYDFDPQGLQVQTGDDVIVETAQGIEFASCTRGCHEIPESAVVKPLSRVLRVATDADRRTMEYHRRREKEAFGIAEQKIADHGLEMKLVNVSSGFEGNKIIFFFTADGRVDFRALVRDLAGVFRSRIELRQIGVRDEARMVGGLGICGRPFCCAQFLDTFLPVSIKMAKTQNLSLNPAKISGACGRLMCCLKYEQYAYEDAARRLPKPESFVQTPDGPGNVKAVDLLRETVKVALDSEPEPYKTYHTSEIILLRSGKGSREGIEIPPRPARRVEEKREDASFEPVFLDNWDGEDDERMGGGPAADGGPFSRTDGASQEADGVYSDGAVPGRPYSPDRGQRAGRTGKPYQNRTGTGNRNQPPYQNGAGNRNQPPYQSGAGNRNQPPYQSGAGNRNQPPYQSGAGNRNQPPYQSGAGNRNQGTRPGGGNQDRGRGADSGQRGSRGGWPSGTAGAYGRNPPPTAEDWAEYESMSLLSPYAVDESDERHRNRNQSGRKGRMDQRGGKFQKQGRDFQKRDNSYEGGEQKRRGNRNYYRGNRRNRGGKAPE